MSEVLKLSSIPIGFSKIEGVQGPQGPAGPTYRLDCNVTSVTRGLIVPIAPEEIVFSAVEIDEENNKSTQLTFNKDGGVQGFTLKLEDGWVGRVTGDLEEDAGEESTIINTYTEIDNDDLVYSIDSTTITLSMTPVEKGAVNEEVEAIDEEISVDGGFIQQGGYASGEAKEDAVSIRATLYKDGIPIIITSIPIVSDPNLIALGEIKEGQVYIGKGKVITSSIYANAITAEKIAAGSVETDHFAANRIVSNNYEALVEGTAKQIGDQIEYFYPKEEDNEGNTIYPYGFTNKGSFFDLTVGGLHTPGFYVTPNGDAGLKGHIEAKSGSILGTLSVGEGARVTISGEEDKPFIQAGDAFSLTQEGHLTTTSANIGGWDVDSENLYKSILKEDKTEVRVVGLHSGDTMRENSPIRFYAGSNQDLSKKEFTVTENGTLYASMARISGEINATGGSISGELTVGNNGIVINGSENANPPYISSAQYASGAAGWKIDNNGFAEFGDAYIRGTLRSTVFETNTVSAVGGDLYVAPTIKIKQEDLISQNIEGDIFTLICSNEALKDTAPEQPIRKQWDNSVVLLGFNAIKNSKEVTFDKVQGTLSFNPDGTELELIMSISENELSGDLIIKTDLTVIKLGQGTDRHYIHLTANTGNISTPYLDVYSAPMDAQNVLPKVRLGNLSGINDEDNFGGVLSGYGLYSNNAYITGLLALPNAGITNQTKVGYTGEGSYAEIVDEEKAGTAIRYWAGSSMPKVGDMKAPFIVTQDGTLYATKGVFEGKVIASESQFSGTIQAAGIVIDKKDIEGSPPSKGKNHFFVGYSSEPKDYDDYVLDISRYGLRVWEGGFNVYSDTLSGWPMDEEERNEENADPLYGYTSKNQNPYPYISAIDAGRMAIRDINIMSPIGDKSFSSIYSTNGALHFGKIKSAQEGENFASVESSLFNEALSSLQVENNAFTMKTPSAAMRVNEKVSSIEAQSENFIVSNLKAAAKMSFNNEISIEEVKQQVEDADGKLVMETIGFNFLI